MNATPYVVLAFNPTGDAKVTGVGTSVPFEIGPVAVPARVQPAVLPVKPTYVPTRTYMSTVTAPPKTPRLISSDVMLILFAATVRSKKLIPPAEPPLLETMMVARDAGAEVFAVNVTLSPTQIVVSPGVIAKVHCECRLPERKETRIRMISCGR